MINFCHIVPNSYLSDIEDYPTHLLLAHLVEESEDYRNFYINLKKKNPSVFYHLDNSAFEMFKRGVPMYDPSKLVEMGKLVGADSIVLSDYPKEHFTKTIESAKELIPQFKAQGFKTFYVPQSELGDLDGLISSFDWAIQNREVDYIGVSILACPIALGVNETKHGDDQRDDAFRMQRYLSRWAIFEELSKRGLLSLKSCKRFHCLGMTDGPREIEIVRQYHDFIYSWDSSTAVWHGINGIRYDNSPTGLRMGKFEKEVDFDIDRVARLDFAAHALYNRHMIDNMCLGEV